MNFEVRTTVELHKSIKGLFPCRLLQLFFWTALSLVITLQQPYYNITCGRKQNEFKGWPYGIDYQQRDHVIADSSVPILVEIPVESLEEGAEQRDFYFHRYQQLQQTIIKENHAEDAYQGETHASGIVLELNELGHLYEKNSRDHALDNDQR